MVMGLIVFGGFSYEKGTDITKFEGETRDSID